MDTPITSLNGQLILERMKFNESSDLAHGFHAAVDAVWKSDPHGTLHAGAIPDPATGRRVKRHHLVLMLTDALSREFSPQASPLRQLRDDYALQVGNSNLSTYICT